MVISLRKQLMNFLLIAALLAPLNTFAHEVTSEAAQDTCVCLLLAKCETDESGKRQGHFPGNNAADHCDNKDCCPDAAEPPLFCALRVNISESQLFHPLTSGRFPEVYLAIFVPPEN